MSEVKIGSKEREQVLEKKRIRKERKCGMILVSDTNNSFKLLSGVVLWAGDQGARWILLARLDWSLEG